MAKKSFAFYLLIILTLLIFLFKDSNSQTFDTAYARKLQNAVNNLRTSNNLKGISAAAYVPGQGLWTGASGISHVGADMSTDMVFSIGSITKNFVAAVILQLAEADSLQLTDHLYQWLPHIQNVDSNITITQLLKHTSGIYNYTDNASFVSAMNSDLNRYWQPEEALPYILTPYFAPGAGWRYSNTNYLLLGIIIKKIMGSKLGEQIHQRLYTPLQMNASFIEVDDTLTLPFAHNWADLNGDGILDDAINIPLVAFYTSTIGAGGVISRPDNLTTWMRSLYGGRVISQNSINQMTTFTNASISGANGYGLGTMRYNVSGKICWGHGGNSFGHSAVAMYYPVDSIAIALCINVDGFNTGPSGISFMNTVLTNRPVSINNISSVTPDKYNLYQNYPNPFNPETSIKFDISKTENIKVKIYNSIGKEVKNIFHGKLDAGSYSVKWNAADFPSGIYFYKLESENFTAVKKMILVK